MTTLIEQIKLKADSIPTNTKENRRAKGAYVDCLMMAKEANKNFIKSGVSGEFSLLNHILEICNEDYDGDEKINDILTACENFR